MKKYLALLVCFSMVLQLTAFTGKETKAENKWEGYIAVSSKQELNAIREDPAARYYLTADIEFKEADFKSGGEFYNAGRGWEIIETFTGVLDGNGHAIKGLQIERRVDQVGLVGINEGEIKNLTFDHAIVRAPFTLYSGIVAGTNKGTLENITITDSSSAMSNSSVTGTWGSTEGAKISGYVGGVCGRNSGCIRTSAVRNTTVENFSSISYVQAGGICGDQRGEDSEIVDCYVTGGEVTCEETAGGSSENSKSSQAGGIAGGSMGGLIKRCYNASPVSAIRPNYRGYATDAAGINGGNGGIIEECFNVGTLTSTSGQVSRKRGICCGGGQVINSYYLYGTANQGRETYGDGIGRGESLTRKQMKVRACWVGFNFTEDWVLDPGSGINYPQLRRNRQVADSGIPEPDDDKDQSGVPEGYTGIFDVQDLFCIRNNLSGKYILMNDIDLTEATGTDGLWNFAKYGWKPLSDGSENGFTGELDGNDHTIRGLTMTGDIIYDYDGLFEINNGIIKNIIFENAKISHSDVSNVSSGIVAGINKGTIENVTLKKCNLYIFSEAISSSRFAGGICGKNAGRIDKCVVVDCVIENAAHTKKVNYCGGICGIQTSGQSEVTNSYVLDSDIQARNSWTISGATESDREAYAGGITGENNGVIRKCYNTSSVLAVRGSSSYAYYAYAGGIAGIHYNGKQGNIYDCFNLGRIAVEGKGGCKVSGIAYNAKDAKACYSLKGVLKNGDTSCSESLAACGTFLEEDISKKESYPEFDFDHEWVIDPSSGIAYPQICEFREVHVKSAELVAVPQKLEFFQGDEIDPRGGQLRVSYVENTNTGLIDLEKYMLSGYDMKNLGRQTVTVTYDGKVCSYEINVKPVPVSSVSMEEKETEINKGETRKLQAEILPSTATDKTLVWETSDADIAEVDANGEVRAKALGTATISVCSTNGKRAECVVTVVSRAASVRLNTTELVINKGEVQELTYEAFPEDTTDSFTWDTSDADIVDVDDKGKITANGRGTAQITVTASSGVSGVCNVKVLVPASEVQVSEKAITLLQEKTALVSAKLLPEDSTDNYVWSSEDDEIATVTEEGMITARNPGVVKITAEAASGVKECIEVTVLPAYHVTDIQFPYSEMILERGGAETLAPQVIPANYTDEVTYRVENEDVAVIEEGKLKALTTGTTYVNVTSSNGVSAKCKVTVIVSSENITMNMNDAVISIGDHLKLSVELFPEDTTDCVVWSSGDENVAKVDETGEVSAVSVGECSIYARSDSGKSAECKIHVIENKIISSLNDWREISKMEGEAKYILNEDIDVGNTSLDLPEQSTLRLDLNGHTIIGTGTIINNSGRLTIDDTSAEKNGGIRTLMIGSDVVIKYCVVNTGSLYINGGNIQADVTVTGKPSSPWAVALRNAGYVQISGGSLKADSVSAAKSLGINRAYGILNHEDGVIDMSGGDISVTTETKASNVITECSTSSYGIYNNTSNTVSITGGTINCSHREVARGKKNTLNSAGLYNNANGKILLAGGEVTVTCTGGPSKLKGGLLGMVNGGESDSNKGNIEMTKGKIKVESMDADGLLVAGIMNVYAGEITVGSDKSVNKEDISIKSSMPNNKDYVISNELGKLAVCRGILQGGYGIVSNMDYSLGEDDGIITSDQLSLEAKGLLFIGKGNIILNDGRYKGTWDLSEGSNQGSVFVPRGYVMSNSTLNNVDDGELVPIEYDITYMLDGGINNVLNPAVYNITTPKTELKSPSKEGYNFEGWYEDSGFINKVTEISGVDCEDKVLYAKWKKNTSNKEHSYPGTSPGSTTGNNYTGTSNGVNLIPRAGKKKESGTETPAYTSVSDTVGTFIKPAKIKKLKVKRFKKNGINVRFSKVAGVSAYEIKYGINKKFKKAKSKIIRKNNLNIKSLKKKKVYYVKVRAFKFHEGRKVYGSWSSVKRIKVGK